MWDFNARILTAPSLRGREDASQYLEYLKSWIKWIPIPTFNFDRWNRILYGEPPHDLTPIQKLSRIRWIQRHSRVKMALRGLTFRHRKRKTFGRRAAKALTLAMTFVTCCAATSQPMTPEVANLQVFPSIIAMHAEHQAKTMPQDNMWDTDSRSVGHDTRASACISDDERDFIAGTLRPVSRTVRVFGGYMQTKMQIGTLKWNVLHLRLLRSRTHTAFQMAR